MKSKPVGLLCALALLVVAVFAGPYKVIVSSTSGDTPEWGPDCTVMMPEGNFLMVSFDTYEEALNSGYVQNATSGANDVTIIKGGDDPIIDVINPPPT
jgi:hypothetical protein